MLSVSTTTTLGIPTAAALGEAAPGASHAQLLMAAATLTVLVGAILVGAGLLRLGFVANFISEPVLAGFKAAIGLVIIVDQVPKLLGIHAQKVGFFRDVLHVLVPALGVKTVGAIPGGLPSPTLPDLGLLGSLWGGAVGIALMSFTETIAAGRAFAALAPALSLKALRARGRS